MAEEDYSRYYEMLELDKNATLTDVKRAYLHLKELYSTESIVTSPIMDEFPDGNRNEILDLIEDARRKLTEMFENEEYEKAFKSKGPQFSAESLFIALIFQQQKMISRLIESLSSNQNKKDQS